MWTDACRRNLSKILVVGETTAMACYLLNRSLGRTTLKMRTFYLSLLAFLLLPLGNLFADPITFNWSGLPIEGEDPAYLPSGSAVFDISGGTLKITLTDTTAQTLT